MDASLLPASAYNALPLIDDHQRRRKVGVTDLQALADCLVTYELHQHWGVGLLHRHAEAPERHIMVHELCGEHIECLAVEAGLCRNSQSTALFLNGDGLFQGYEYQVSGEKRPQSCDQALRVLRSRLQELQLDKTMAIVARSLFGVEYAAETTTQSAISGHPLGTHSIAQATLEDSKDLITNWVFNSTSSGLEIIRSRSCRTLPSGLHEVKQD